MADFELAEKLICERYNVAALPESFAGAMTAARGGDDSRLRELLAEREMYRWREPIDAALVEDEAPAVEPDTGTVDVFVPSVSVSPVGNDVAASTTTTVSSETTTTVTADESAPADKPAEETPKGRSKK